MATLKPTLEQQRAQDAWNRCGKYETAFYQGRFFIGHQRTQRCHAKCIFGSGQFLFDHCITFIWIKYFF